MQWSISETPDTTPGTDDGSLRVAFLESFYGGSHREFADCFTQHSQHTIGLFTLPAANWGWRLRWAARSFAAELLRHEPYDVVLASDLINLADLRSFLGSSYSNTPFVLYMHESQLGYPRSDGKVPPLEHTLTDIKNVLHADVVLFNSHFHREAFLSAADKLLSGLPGFSTQVEKAELRTRSTVAYPGCDLPQQCNSTGSEPAINQQPCIVWNHRWEPDKQPHVFRTALRKLRDKGEEFRLILLGEQPLQVVDPHNGEPAPIYLEICEEFADQILHAGYAETRDEYFRLLEHGNIVLSTAIQENFGLSMLQAIAAGCVPLAPNRLAYPEVIPTEVHETCLYGNTSELVSKLKNLCGQVRMGTHHHDESLRRRAAEFAWPQRRAEFDQIIRDAAEGRIHSVGKVTSES